MAGYDEFRYTQSVPRRIPGHIRVIQWMLYFCVLIFTILGAMQGPIWLFPALGTLFGSWYFMGAARVTYRYLLEGAVLTVERTSGLKSRPKTVTFGEFDLTRLIAMGPEGSPLLEKAEADSAAASPRRITYDVSAHDPDDICSVMYLTGVEKGEDRAMKVFFQPMPELRDYIRQIAPGKVFGYGE